MTPAAGISISGQTFELVGSITQSPGREVSTASIDLGDGTPRPLTLSGTTWRITIPLPAALEATRAFTITALDASGMTSTSSVSVSIDTLAPRLTLTSPMTGTAVGATPRLVGTVVDATTVSTVTVDIGGGGLPATVTPTGDWQLDVSFPVNLDRVSQAVTLTATDGAGNQATQMVTVLVDTRGPTLTFTSPAAGERLGVPATQSLEGLASDGSGVSTVTVNCGDAAGLQSATVTGGTWTRAWALPSADGTSFTCTVTARDPLSNQSVVTRTFTVDTVGPMVALVSPAAGALLGGPSQSTVQITATVSDGSNQLGAVSMMFGGQTGNPTGTGPSFSLPFSLPSVDFQTEMLTVRAFDAEGNSSTVSRSVFVDKVAPQVSFLVPGANQVFNIASFSGGNDVTLSWTMTDADPQTQQQLNGSAIAGTARMASVTTSASDNRVTYTRTLQATDRAGNTTSVGRSFIVDRVAPTVTGTSPANDSRLNVPRVATVTFSEPMSTAAHGLNGVGGGSWNGPQTTWSSNSLSGSTVFSATVNSGAADLAGNAPASLPTWRFHTAPLLPASGTLLASNVRAFDVMSDLDGQPFIGIIQFGSAVANSLTLDGANGSFAFDQAGLVLQQASYQDVHVQLESRVGSGLGLVRTRSLNGFGALPPPVSSTVQFVKLSVDEATATSPSGLPVVSPPIEALDGTAAIGTFITTTYSRSPVSESIPFTPQKIIPGSQLWVAFSADTLLRAAHRLCITSFLTGMRSCGFDHGTLDDSVNPSTVLRSISGATSTGGCLIYAFDNSGGARRVQIWGTRTGLQIGANYSSVAAPGPGFTVARRNAGGHYAAWASDPSTIRISSSTNPTSCSTTAVTTNWTFIRNITVPFGVPFRVVELGTSPAILYLDGSDLRLVY